jgi:MinD-like ATPase involved in chromosome partitioning or flagellar assembly
VRPSKQLTKATVVGRVSAASLVVFIVVSLFGQPILADLGGWSLAGVQRKLRATGLDYLFLDCPPGISRFQRAAIWAADLVLVLTGASVLDLAAIASPRKWRIWRACRSGSF